MNNHPTLTSTKRTKKGYDSLQHHTFCLNQLLNYLISNKIYLDRYRDERQ